MTPASRPLSRRTRLGVLAAVALIHLVVIAALVRAFTPEIPAKLLGAVTRSFDIALEPPPEPTPAPELTPTARPTQADAPREEGAAGAAGKRAEPRDAAVPEAPVAIRPTAAPPVAGTGTQNRAGAAEAGEGSGAAGAGRGPGAGGAGSGTGGGGAVSKPVKIAGDINSARDYPRASRALRLGHEVVIMLRVGADGRATACRVLRASPDAEADRITCRLAVERFRFRPARDAQGRAVEAEYGWRQRWFPPGQDAAPDASPEDR